MGSRVATERVRWARIGVCARAPGRSAILVSGMVGLWAAMSAVPLRSAAQPPEESPADRAIPEDPDAPDDSAPRETPDQPPVDTAPVETPVDTAPVEAPPVEAGEASDSEPPLATTSSDDSTSSDDAQPPGEEPEDLGAIEDIDLEALLLDPVVTSSGGEAEERVLASGNVIVIRREDFLRNGWRTVAEALSAQVGLYVIDDLVVPSVAVRGVSGGLRAGTRIVRMMINGVEVAFRPDLTAFIGAELIPLELVERVEIVQGPLSAVYGANAFLATINVITRDATDQSSTEVAGRFLLTSGNPGFGFSASTIHGGADWGVLLGATADFVDRSGLTISPTFAAQDPSLERYSQMLGARTSGDLSQPMSAFAQLHVGGVRGAYGRFTLQAGVQRLDSAPELQVGSVMSHRSRLVIDNYHVDLRHEAEWSELVSTTIDVGYSGGRPSGETTLALANNFDATWSPRFGYHAFNGSAAIVISPLGRQLSFRVAGDVVVDVEDILFYRQTSTAPRRDGSGFDSRDLIAPATSRQQTITDIGVALGVTSVPSPEGLPGLRLTGDLRVDFIRYGPVEFPAQLSWRAGVIYQWSRELTTKIVGGQAFQTPSSVLMFAQGGYGIANNVLGNFDVNVLGVPRLRPQVVTGVEAIASLALLDGALEVDVGVFAQSVSDRIAFNQLGTDFVAVNAESQSALGLLLSARLEVDRVGAWANASGQAQILDQGLSLRPPEQYPSIFGAAGVDVSIPEIHLRLGAVMRWAGERGATQSNTLLNDGTRYTLAPYALFDVTLASMDLRVLGDSETRLLVSIRNLFDARYSEPYVAGYDIPNIGRTLWVEVRQVF